MPAFNSLDRPPIHVHKLIDPIVIVEDDKLIREGFSLLISSTYGYRVVGSYASCEEALRQLEEDQPEVVLMDIELPGMGGIACIEKSRRPGPEPT